MNKKNVVVYGILMLTMLVFAGCKGAGDEADKRFTYDWELYSITSDGKTVVYTEQDQAFAPEFSSSDGVTCTFTNKGNEHKGTIEKKEGSLYTIQFEDSSASMEAELTDDTLTLTINGGSMVLLFKTDN